MRRALLPAISAAVLGTVAAGASVAVAASPSVTTGDASAVTNSAATVSGTVNPNGQPTRYAFQYGTTSGLGQETPLVSAGSTSVQAVSARIGGLISGTTYHYRIIAISAGGTATGLERTFKTTGTPPPPKVKPTAGTGPAVPSVNGATLTGSVGPNALATTYYFEFGPTSAYGYQTSPASAGSGTSTVSVTALLSGLQSNQTYHYRLVAVSGAGTTLGADATFKTTTAPPTASKLDVFGHTAFVAPQGVGGIFLGCIGQTTCTGKMTIRRGSETIGQRLRFTIGANDGGIVHYTLTRRGQSLLRRLHHMLVTVVVRPTQGPTVSRGVTLVPFS